MAKVENPELTPSGQILKTMQARQLSFYSFAMEQSEAHKAYFMDSALDPETTTRMEETSALSLTKQKEIEAADNIDFDEFLMQWNTYCTDW